MNVDTGYLRRLLEEEKPSDREILIEESELTEKQKKTNKVSLKDNRSKAGKKLQSARKNIRFNDLTRNQKRNIKKKIK